jgi:hypothetical protein
LLHRIISTATMRRCLPWVLIADGCAAGKVTALGNPVLLERWSSALVEIRGLFARLGAWPPAGSETLGTGEAWTLCRGARSIDSRTIHIYYTGSSL